MLKLIPLLLCLFASPLFAEAPVWKVSKGGNELYLGGTVHILRKSDYPLPAEFNKAYKKSKIVVLETILSDDALSSMILQLTQTAVYPNGKTLKDHLRPDVFKKLSKFMLEVGFPLPPQTNFKPSVVYLIATMMELNKIGANEEGVDEHFKKKAEKDRKELIGLETISEQLSLLMNLGEDDPNKFILQSIEQIGKLSKEFPSIIAQWKSGNLKLLEEALVTSLKKNSPEMYENLLVKRNRAWIPQIEEMLETKKVEFVLVGYAHLAGDEGVIKQLRDLGYRIEKF